MEKSAVVTMKGITALLMHSYPMVPIDALEKKSPQEQAEYAAYRDPETAELYIPGVAVQRALVASAAFSKGKGRATLQKPVAACLFVNPERISTGQKEYKIDARPVVIPATKGRIMRFRPRLDNWEISFQLQWDDTLLKELEVRQVVDHMGSRVGLLDFRPEKKGPFGRSIVTRWETT
jgi:hypothetical protein